MNATLETFEQHRGRLGQLAYRMLGSRSDADDVLQEAYLRWSKVNTDDVTAPSAYLSKIVTRLCIDRRREIDARKEVYIGPWLPEPFVHTRDASQFVAEMADSVSMAFLYLLERLSPTERAAYVLRKILSYDYAEIASILEKSLDNCRQIVSRAEQQLFADRPRFTANPEAAEQLTSRFLQACASGDLNGLLQILADDAVLISDGGGKATAALRPIDGADKVARFFLGIFRKSPENARAVPVRVNGTPGFAAYLGDDLVSLFAFDIVDGKVHSCYAIRNPDKLERPSRDLADE